VGPPITVSEVPLNTLAKTSPAVRHSSPILEKVPYPAVPHLGCKDERPDWSRTCALERNHRPAATI